MFHLKNNFSRIPKQKLIQYTVLFVVIYLFVYTAFVVFLASQYDYTYSDDTSVEVTENRIIQHKLKSNQKVAKTTEKSLEIYNKRNYSDLNFDFEDKCFFESHLCFAFSRCYNINEQSRLLRSANPKPRIKIHVYASQSAQNKFSHEFDEFIRTILDSDYFESDPRKACIFVPLIDFTSGYSLPADSRKQLNTLK
jgi:hypothetical protein